MVFSPYSHSKLDSYRNCPRKFKLHYIDKIKVPFVTNLALFRGSYFHECLEYWDNRPDFKTNNIFTQNEKDKTLERVHTYMNSELGKFYHNKHGKNEEEFGFKIIDGNLVSTTYYDKNAWIRGKIDYSYWENNEKFIIDYKTGKDKSKDTKYFSNDQMITYAVDAFTKHPELDKVNTVFIYVEHLTQRKETFYRKDLKSLIYSLYKDTKNCEVGNYDMKVGPLCNYCDFKIHEICTGEVEIDNSKIEMM